MARRFYCRDQMRGVRSPPMSARSDDTTTISHNRRQPLWPWLLMPLVALTVFLLLRNARELPSRPAPLMSPPGETTEIAPPGTASH